MGQVLTCWGGVWNIPDRWCNANAMGMHIFVGTTFEGNIKVYIVVKTVVSLNCHFHCHAIVYI